MIDYALTIQVLAHTVVVGWGAIKIVTGVLARATKSKNLDKADKIVNG